MSGAVNVLTFIDALFILLLSLAGSLSQMSGLYGIAYVLAFAIPTVIGFFVFPKFKREREEERGLAESLGNYLSITKRGATDFVFLVFPTVAVIFLCSYLTGLVLSLLGFSNAGSYEGVSILTMMLENALVPSVLEELLFRFIPILLLAPYGKRGCIMISALYFAMIHGSLFSIPYAFVAGVIFMTVDLMYDSVIPSLILHFVNNAASVLWMKLCTPENPVATWIFLGVLALGTEVSVVVILKNKKRYAESFHRCFLPSERIKTYSPMIIVAIGLMSAALSLMGK